MPSFTISTTVGTTQTLTGSEIGTITGSGVLAMPLFVTAVILSGVLSDAQLVVDGRIEAGQYAVSGPGTSGTYRVTANSGSYVSGDAGFIDMELSTASGVIDLDGVIDVFDRLPIMSLGSGNDTIILRPGADVRGYRITANVLGNGGIDTLDYSNCHVGLSVNLFFGHANAFNTTVESFENLIGSGLHDSLTGSADANMITGGAGNDTIQGGAGNDTLEGGAGNDGLDGGTGTDTASFAAAGAAVFYGLLAQGSAFNTQGAGTDNLSGFENLTGSTFNDTLGR
jgi:Ca2+-binding RTX toxin-like protein